MIVVSDTSPLTALLTVGGADILPQLFSEVVIPGLFATNCGAVIQTSHPGCALLPWRTMLKL